MGEILRATCRACGFTEEVIFGSGMSDHLAHCSVPAIDRLTGQLCSENYYKKELFDGQYLFYNELEMFRRREKGREIQWRDIKLSRTDNLCPRCKQFTMDFKPVIYFD